MEVEFLPGNRLTLLRSGVEYFPALEAAIRGARREVFLETYIYAGDATGRRITRALCEAASRGAAGGGFAKGARDAPPGGGAGVEGGLEEDPARRLADRGRERWEIVHARRHQRHAGAER